MLHHLQTERAASCSAVAATSVPSMSSTQSIEKALSRLLDQRTRTDDALASAKRAVILSFYAQRALLKNVSTKEGSVFAIISTEWYRENGLKHAVLMFIRMSIWFSLDYSSSFSIVIFCRFGLISVHDGGLLLNAVATTLAAHRAVVDPVCLRKGRHTKNEEDNSSTEGSPSSTDSSNDAHETVSADKKSGTKSQQQKLMDEILSVWSSRFLYVTEQLTTGRDNTDRKVFQNKRKKMYSNPLVYHQI